MLASVVAVAVVIVVIVLAYVTDVLGAHERHAAPPDLRPRPCHPAGIGEHVQP